MELRPIEPQHRQQILALLTNEKIKKAYMLPDFETEDAAIPLFQRLMALSREEGRFVRGIFDGDLAVGFLNDVEIENGSIELGYVIHPDHWGRGYATAALKEAIRQLFAMGYRQVTAGAFSGNAASLRVMEKAGMTRLEKTDTVEYRGTRHRCVYYAIENE